MSLIYQQLFLIITQSILCILHKSASVKINGFTNMNKGNVSEFRRGSVLTALSLANVLGYEIPTPKAVIIGAPRKDNDGELVIFQHSTSTAKTSRSSSSSAKVTPSRAEALENAYKMTGRQSIFKARNELGKASTSLEAQIEAISQELGLNEIENENSSIGFSSKIKGDTSFPISNKGTPKHDKERSFYDKNQKPFPNFLNQGQSFQSRAEAIENAYRATGRQRPFRSEEFLTGSGIKQKNLIPEPLDFGNGILKASSGFNAISYFKTNSSDKNILKNLGASSNSSIIRIKPKSKALLFNKIETKETTSKEKMNLSHNQPITIQTKENDTTYTETSEHSDSQLSSYETGKQSLEFEDNGGKQTKSPFHKTTLELGFSPSAYNPFNPFLQLRMPKFNTKLPLRDLAKLHYYTQRFKPNSLISEGSNKKNTITGLKIHQSIRPKQQIVYRKKRKTKNPDEASTLKPFRFSKNRRSHFRTRKPKYKNSTNCAKWRKLLPEQRAIRELTNNRKKSKQKLNKRRPVLLPLIINYQLSASNETIMNHSKTEHKGGRRLLTRKKSHNQEQKQQRVRRSALPKKRRPSNKLSIRPIRPKTNQDIEKPSEVLRVPKQASRTKLVRPQTMQPKAKSPADRSLSKSFRRPANAPNVANVPNTPILTYITQKFTYNTPKFTHITLRPGLIRPVIPRVVASRKTLRIPRGMFHP